MKKERINIYIHPERYEAICKIAEKEERSISSMIDRILILYIASEGGSPALRDSKKKVKK